MMCLIVTCCALIIGFEGGSNAALVNSANSPVQGYDDGAEQSSAQPVIRHRAAYEHAADAALCSESDSTETSGWQRADQPRDRRMIDTSYSRHMFAVLPDLRPLVNFTGTLGMYEIFLLDIQEEISFMRRPTPESVEQQLNDMWKPQIESANYSTSAVRVVITDWVEHYWFSASGQPLISVVFALALDDSVLNRTSNGTKMLPAIVPLSLEEMQDYLEKAAAAAGVNQYSPDRGWSAYTSLSYIGPVFHGYTLAIRNVSALMQVHKIMSPVEAPALLRDYLLGFLNSSQCASSGDNGTSTDQIDIKFGYPYMAIVHDQPAYRLYRLYNNDLAVAFIITVNNKAYQGPYPFTKIKENGLTGVKLMFLHGDRYRIDPYSTFYPLNFMMPEFVTPRYWVAVAKLAERALQQKLKESNTTASVANEITFTVSALMVSAPPDAGEMVLSVHVTTSTPPGAFLMNAALPLFERIQQIISGLRRDILYASYQDLLSLESGNLCTPTTRCGT
ncbi:uncharacterized protein LOC129595792 [Paramacrobiotus metropolitanus]|uniref:uncharacterized protein LOC129595792 n=1 Tax=Paramacrobiotus metropolitanus TaxID=2943436 RepID=UPI0024463084|nr:uncharacterized protein LOC129595792 [Paramacrobiotus metropolitanus]